MADDQAQDKDPMQGLIEQMVGMAIHRLLQQQVLDVFGIDLDKPAENVQHVEFENFLDVVTESMQRIVFEVIGKQSESVADEMGKWRNRALGIADLFQEHLQEAHGIELDTYSSLRQAEMDLVAGVDDTPCSTHGLPLDAAAFKGAVTLQSDDGMHELALKRFVPEAGYCQEIECYQGVVEKLGDKLLEEHNRLHHDGEDHHHG